VGEIAEALDHEMVVVSHHLGILFQAGILQREKRGRFVVYRLGKEILETRSRTGDFLDLGCCRLEVPK
jgi:DNA-binding transcriptional ArsR family regulator